MTVGRQAAGWDKPGANPQSVAATFPDTPGVQVVAAATGAATAACAPALAATAAVTNWITGFEVTTDVGGATIVVPITVTGLAAGTLSYKVTETTTAGARLQVTFPQPLPASAVNTAITVTYAATANSGASAVNVYGYQL